MKKIFIWLSVIILLFLFIFVIKLPIERGVGGVRTRNTIYLHFGQMFVTPQPNW